jgi:hypothetical protein
MLFTMSSANGEKAKSSVNPESNPTPLERIRKRSGIASDISSEPDDGQRKKPRIQQGIDIQFETYELIATAIRDQKEARQSNVIIIIIIINPFFILSESETM